MKHLLTFIVLHHALLLHCAVAQMDGGDGMPPPPPDMMFDEQPPMEFMVGDPMQQQFEEQPTFDTDIDMGGAEPFVGAEFPAMEQMSFGGAPMLPMPEDQGFEQPATFEEARNAHLWSSDIMREHEEQVSRAQIRDSSVTLVC